MIKNYLEIGLIKIICLEIELPNTSNMQNLIALKDLKLNIKKYTTKVKLGQSFIVIEQNKPLFKIIPINKEAYWQEVIDFTKIEKDGVSIDKLLPCL